MAETHVDLGSLHALEIRTLLAFEDQEHAECPDGELPSLSGLGPGQLRRALEWLLSKGLLEVTGEAVVATVSLTENGVDFTSKGATPETALLARASQSPGPTLKELQQDGRFDKGEWGSAFGGLRQEGVVATEGETIVIPDPEKAAFYTDRLIPDLYGRFEDGDRAIPLTDLSEEVQDYVRNKTRKRGKSRAPVRLDEQTERTYRLTVLGKSTLQQLVKADLTGEEVSQLVPDMLQDGAWKSLSFRRYDLSLKPPRILMGRHHGYRSYLDGVRRKLLSLGFEEMKGSLVETEFWNMDALFMPQFHSARDIHDAYYIKTPHHARKTEEPYYSQVGQAHEDGGDTGSRGWRYSFDPDRSRRLILRTQGTALSARTLAAGPHIPGKYFAIARCFRPDDVDATHSADFIQVEGIVLGHSITFRSLLGLLKLFALEIAQAADVRYVPDYFPFTEPSVELQAKHPTRGWIELGGAGLFRPELTHPLGVDVPVIAWGLGVDRMAMVALGIDDIRDLFSADLDFVRNEK